MLKTLILSLLIASSVLAYADENTVTPPTQVVPLDDGFTRALIVQTLQGTSIDLAECEVKFVKAIIMTDEQGVVNLYRVRNIKTGNVYEIGVAFHIQLSAEKGV